MKPVRRALSVAAAWLLLAAPASGEVRLAIADGLVTLEATDATLREILGEWARVGRTRIFNAELVTGDPLTIRLEGVAEERALEILLRTLNGYLAAPRATPLAGASRFDRLMLMPGTARPRSAAIPAPSQASGNDLLTQGPALPEPEQGQGDDERPVRVVPAPGQRGNMFRNPPPTAPRPVPTEQAPPPARPAYTPKPIAPVGVPVPGMIVPTPEDTDSPASRPSSGS